MGKVLKNEAYFSVLLLMTYCTVCTDVHLKLFVSVNFQSYAILCYISDTQ